MIDPAIEVANATFRNAPTVLIPVLINAKGITIKRKVTRIWPEEVNRKLTAEPNPMILRAEGKMKMDPISPCEEYCVCNSYQYEACSWAQNPAHPNIISSSTRNSTPH